LWGEPDVRGDGDQMTAGRRDLRERRDTWNGFGNTLSRAIELVATPVLLGLGGWGLDRWLGTRPAFMLVLFLFGVIGMALRTYYAYVAEMEAHEQEAPWRRR
jgi:F0F1-type ATP synthase assembly protein I